MMMSLLVTLTLVAQNDAVDNERTVQSFADRLKASHELKKPEAMEHDDNDDEKGNASKATRHFQVRMTQSVAGRR